MKAGTAVWAAIWPGRVVVKNSKYLSKFEVSYQIYIYQKRNNTPPKKEIILPYLSLSMLNILIYGLLCDKIVQCSLTRITLGTKIINSTPLQLKVIN